MIIQPTLPTGSGENRECSNPFEAEGQSPRSSLSFINEEQIGAQLDGCGDGRHLSRIQIDDPRIKISDIKALQPRRGRLCPSAEILWRRAVLTLGEHDRGHGYFPEEARQQFEFPKRCEVSEGCRVRHHDHRLRKSERVRASSAASSAVSPGQASWEERKSSVSQREEWPRRRPTWALERRVWR